MYSLNVKASKDYDVLVGSNIINKIGWLIKERICADKLMIVADENAYKLHFKSLSDTMSKEGSEFEAYVMPAGERSKSLEEYSAVIAKMVLSGFNRNSAVVSFGGGVAGDMAGFVASTYMRGIPVVHIPTTLLAQCDSSVGGKTALDIPSAKNIIGSVWQPELVVCDTAFLKTLPKDVRLDGMGEILKYAVLNGEHILKCQNDTEMIYNALKIKAEYISEDEYDNSSRRMLNLGHTVGHAFETLSGYEISHGRAVVFGMEVIIKAALKRGICSSDFAEKFTALKGELGFGLKPNFPSRAVYDAICNDKKRRAEKLALVIPLNFGKCVIKEMSFLEACGFIEGGLY